MFAAPSAAVIGLQATASMPTPVAPQLAAKHPAWRNVALPLGRGRLHVRDISLSVFTSHIWLKVFAEAAQSAVPQAAAAAGPATAAVPAKSDPAAVVDTTKALKRNFENSDASAKNESFLFSTGLLAADACEPTAGARVAVATSASPFLTLAVPRTPRKTHLEPDDTKFPEAVGDDAFPARNTSRRKGSMELVSSVRAARQILPPPPPPTHTHGAS